MSDIPLKAPFPWFGGKSRAAPLIWERFGPVANYVEPFAGSLAVLLGRPHPPKTETINDLDCYLANFWRALIHSPEDTARWADSPVNEADILARHTFLLANKEANRQRIVTDPQYHDPKLAGWWVWGQCAWIGSGWCIQPSNQLPYLSGAGQGINRKLPHLGNAGRGINRKLPHLGDACRGINRKLPHLGDAGMGIRDYFAQLATRLRRVRVACGDWDRVLSDSVTWRHGLTGIVLDPPYAEGNMEYAQHTAVSAHVAQWCRENGDHKLLRIALCGLEGEHHLPGWTCVPWKAAGGYANQRADGTKNENAARERIWFSPHCLTPSNDLFAS